VRRRPSVGFRDAKNFACLLSASALLSGTPMRALAILLVASCTASVGAGPEQSDGRTDLTVDAPAADAGASTGADAANDSSIPRSIWTPAPGTTWQWQLTGTVDTSFDVAMYDIDLFDPPQSVMDQLHAAGRIVICYFSAGSYENWRSDASSFPAAVLGNALDGWPGERWLDVRSAAVRQIMRARLDRAVTRGCDGVEPDNVDGFANNTGFALTASDQLNYNRFLAAEAHARGLSVGLKNDPDQVSSLVGDFDWELDEECLQFSECGAFAPFIAAGKAVFHVEYSDVTNASVVCPQTHPLHFSTLIKHRNPVDAWRVACPP
jgi:hypothetical protein